MNPMDLLRFEFGTLKELAEIFEVKPNAVTLWGRNGIPVRYLKQIELHTEGRLTKEMLRPDLFIKE